MATTQYSTSVTFAKTPASTVRLLKQADPN